MTSPGQKRQTTKPPDRKEDNVRERTLALETARVLQVKRWEVREEPFRGFDSPPGRF